MTCTFMAIANKEGTMARPFISKRDLCGIDHLKTSHAGHWWLADGTQNENLLRPEVLGRRISKAKEEGRRLSEYAM
jgi:hypothetical protein